MDFFAKNISASHWNTAGTWPPSECSLTTPWILSEISTPCLSTIVLTVQSNVLQGREVESTTWDASVLTLEQMNTLPRIAQAYLWDIRFPVSSARMLFVTHIFDSLI